MKRLLLVALLLLVLAGATAMAIAVALAPTSTAGSAATFAAESPRDQCFFVLAGKNATTDGSVLMGYNNDWSASNYAYLNVVPAASGTYRYVKLMTLGAVPEGGINEKGLAVCYGVATDLAPEVTTADPYVKKGYGGEMWDLLLQKCATATQAVDLLQQMAQTKGFSSACAGSFGIADRTQAWAFELFGGHHWVAARVPDNCYYAQPNMPRIRQVNLADPANFRGSSDLQQFAVDIGRYDPNSGPFDVAWAYGDRADMQDFSNTNRLWIATKRWSPALATDPTMPYATRPVFAVPDHKLSRQDFMAIHREHFEGTQLDQTNGYALMSPHSQTNRPVCVAITDYAAVFQCRSSLPEGIGTVVWWAASRPCASTFVPFYAAVTSVPAAYSSRTAYNAFRAVADSLDKKGTVGGELRYKHYIPLVRSVYGTFETECSNAQASTEATAAAMAPADQSVYLTNYSAQRAAQALSLAQGLPAQMP